ncbi:MAG: GNAT family N-acetyltransferase [Verrucomicrobiales bacterium]|nr:GNAT family N-acetyltransferase [Verrucomicrobiales bacterium]
MSPSLALRPETPADGDFLFSLFASARDDIARSTLAEEEKTRLLRLQFTAQTRHYRTQFPGGEFLIIMLRDRRAGRLCRHFGADEIRIVDLALLPEFRGQGLGTRLLAALQQEARLMGKCLRLHVESHSRARHLYERLGFVKLEQRGLHDFMEWRPDRPFVVAPGLPPR